jgi:hypothetical protein
MQRCRHASHAATHAFSTSDPCELQLATVSKQEDLWPVPGTDAGCAQIPPVLLGRERRSQAHVGGMPDPICRTCSYIP